MRLAVALPVAIRGSSWWSGSRRRQPRGSHFVGSAPNVALDGPDIQSLARSSSPLLDIAVEIGAPEPQTGTSFAVPRQPSVSHEVVDVPLARAQILSRLLRRQPALAVRRQLLPHDPP